MALSSGNDRDPAIHPERSQIMMPLNHRGPWSAIFFAILTPATNPPAQVALRAATGNARQ
jgi:hypothetical protein